MMVPGDLHKVLEVNNRNSKKMMIFVAIVDGHIPIVHAFMGEDGKSQSVNGDRYLQLIEDVAWQALREETTGGCKMESLLTAPMQPKSFFPRNSKGVLSVAVTAVSWPAHSPDLNSLDFHYWGEAQQQVYRDQPGNIEELIECVKKFAAAYGSSTIRRVAENVVKRTRQCVDANGGHFQHLI